MGQWQGSLCRLLQNGGQGKPLPCELWRYGDSNPGPLACHAIPLGSGVFTAVQRAPFCKAFGSGAFTANHSSSKYLLTETLTL